MKGQEITNGFDNRMSSSGEQKQTNTEEVNCVKVSLNLFAEQATASVSLLLEVIAEQ